MELLRQKAMQEHLAGRQEGFQADPQLAKGLQALGLLGGRVRQFHNVSGEDNASRLAWTSNLARQPAGLDRQPGAETVYFVGCVSAMFPMSYAIPQSFVSLLAKAALSFTTLGGAEWCCGFPLMMAGQLAPGPGADGPQPGRGPGPGRPPPGADLPLLLPHVEARVPRPTRRGAGLRGAHRQPSWCATWRPGGPCASGSRSGPGW